MARGLDRAGEGWRTGGLDLQGSWITADPTDPSQKLQTVGFNMQLY